MEQTPAKRHVKRYYKLVNLVYIIVASIGSYCDLIHPIVGMLSVIIMLILYTSYSQSPESNFEAI